MNMSKRFSRAVSLIMCFMLILSCMSVFVSAADDSKEPEPTRFNIISTASCDIVISGINSTSFAVMQTATATSLKIKMELQKLKSGTYTTIETWTATRSNGASLVIEEDRLINIFSTYRLRVTFQAGGETHVMIAYPQ